MDGLLSLANVVRDSLNTFLENLVGLIPTIIVVAIVLVVIFAVYKLLSKALYHGLTRVVRVKQDVNAIMRIWQYIFIFFALVAIILTFSGNLAAAGISIGLLSAALGWALQKPITGIAAWMMITIKRPFKKGDRVIIDNIFGDIKDITMFYIVLEEFGGTIGGEDTSGRIIMIPTALLFEKPITNYTMTTPYVLDEVVNSFTYESNIPKVERIMKNIAEEVTKEYIDFVKHRPFTRMYFIDSGVQVKIRYFAKAKERPKTKSDIVRELHRKVMKEKDLQFAYPHTEVLFKPGAKLKMK